MQKTLGMLLIGYGIVIDFLGTAGAMFDPATGTVGFNRDAISGVIAGGVCGVLSVIWGIFVLRGARWAVTVALATTALFLLAFAWRMAIVWMAIAGGADAKMYAATLITLMVVLSAAMFAKLWAARKTGA